MALFSQTVLMLTNRKYGFAASWMEWHAEERRRQEVGGSICIRSEETNQRGQKNKKKYQSCNWRLFFSPLCDWRIFPSHRLKKKNRTKTKSNNNKLPLQLLSIVSGPFLFSIRTKMNEGVTRLLTGATNSYGELASRHRMPVTWLHRQLARPTK